MKRPKPTPSIYRPASQYVTYQRRLLIRVTWFSYSRLLSESTLFKDAKADLAFYLLLRVPQRWSGLPGGSQQRLWWCEL